MKKYLYILVLCLCCLSCNDEDPAASFYEAAQIFHIVDKDGVDLLNPSNINSLDIKKIKVYFLIDGKNVIYSEYAKQTVPHAQLDNYDGYLIMNSHLTDINYSIGIFLNDALKNNGDIAYTIVEWNENDTDTIKSRVTSSEGYYVSKMVSYNEFVWSPTQEDFIFTIVK